MLKSIITTYTTSKGVQVIDPIDVIRENIATQRDLITKSINNGDLEDVVKRTLEIDKMGLRIMGIRKSFVTFLN